MHAPLGESRERRRKRRETEKREGREREKEGKRDGRGGEREKEVGERREGGRGGGERSSIDFKFCKINSGCRPSWPRHTRTPPGP